MQMQPFSAVGVKSLRTGGGLKNLKTGGGGLLLFGGGGQYPITYLVYKSIL